MNRRAVKARITRLLKKHLYIDARAAGALVPVSLPSGKMYEAYVLGLLAQRLVRVEGFRLRLARGNSLALKSSPGPINRAFPHIEILRDGIVVAEIWTDVEFLSLSYSLSSGSGPLGKGHYHELDIVIVPPNTQGRPSPEEIWLAVECKNTGYLKRMLREILGVRRELSLLHHPVPTRFTKWPRALVPAYPPSCLVVVSSDPQVQYYAAPGQVFGIDFHYEPLPS